MSFRPGSLHNAVLSSLATLSLSSSPSNNGNYQTSGHRSVIATQRLDSVSAAQIADTAVEDHELSTLLPAHSSLGTSGGVTKNGKKRGTTFTCESCSKVAFVSRTIRVESDHVSAGLPSSFLSC